MGVFGRLMFWKKDEPDFKLDEPPKHDLGPDIGMQRDLGMGSDALGMNQDPLTSNQDTLDVNRPAAFQQFDQVQQNQSQFGIPAPTIQKDIEILSAKVDALRAAIESMNQRVINIENIAKGEQEKQQRARW